MNIAELAFVLDTALSRFEKKECGSHPAEFYNWAEERSRAEARKQAEIIRRIPHLYAKIKNDSSRQATASTSDGFPSPSRKTKIISWSVIVMVALLVIMAS